MYHVAAQLCGGHGGEVGCACVVFAAADDAYTTELACIIVLVLLQELIGVKITLVEALKHGRDHVVHLLKKVFPCYGRHFEGL